MENNSKSTAAARTSIRPLVSAGMLLGAGLGGFLDGIVFHQILQTHNMLSAKYPPTNVVNLQVNMFWDGLFHAFTWVMTVSALIALWRFVRRPETVLSSPILAGAVLAGWGLFNVVEGTINHHLLHIHHVREIGNHTGWDLAFLASGAILLLAGWGLIRAGRVAERVS
jgi:uncharacterized membrane protein